MATLLIDRFSPILNKIARVCVIVNEDAPMPAPTLYMLHGGGDSGEGWLNKSGIERLSRDLPFLIVLPDASASWYCDSSVEMNESYLVRELVPFIDRTFKTRRTRATRAIAGPSMGGYGALKLAFKHPEIFGAVAACESSLFFAHSMDDFASRFREIPPVYASIDRKQNDIFALAARRLRHNPKVYFDCGTDDLLLPLHRELHRHLSRLGIKHAFRCFPGAHGMSYAIMRLPDSLKFLRRAVMK